MFSDFKKSLAFIKKEIQSTLSYKYSFFSGIVFGLISLLITFSMASAFKAAIVPEAIPYGGDYLAFLITGAVLWQVVTFGLLSISGSLTVEMATGTLEMIYFSRANLLLSILGVSFFSLMRNTLVATITVLLAVSLFGIAIHLENAFAALILILLTYTSMLGIGIAIAGIAVVTKSVGRVVSIFTLVMSVLSGVAIPLSLLPDWARQFSYLIPVTYSLDGIRRVLLSGAGFGDIQPVLVVLAGLSIILIPLGYLVFQLCLNIARKQGSLGQF
jgi:ABC-2 type transport system permease protein